MAPWRFSDGLFKEEYSAGLLDVSKEEIADEYKSWVSTNEYTFLRHEETGEVIYCLNSKRGNESYAAKQKKKYDEVQKCLDKLVFDSEVHVDGMRAGTVRETHVLFLTFTVAQQEYTVFEAWENVSTWLNNFKAYLTKYLGMGYAAHTVKEANKAGYPAPHMVIILDKPIQCYRHAGKYGGHTWRVRDRSVKDVLQSAWGKYASGSFMDIQAVVGGSVGSTGTVSYYLTKYLGKKVDLSSDVAVYTHAMQKFFNLRDVIGKGFKRAIGMDGETSRLDAYYNELKLKKAKVKRLERKIYGPDPYSYDDVVEVAELNKDIERIKSCLPPPEWVFVGSYTLYAGHSFQGFMDKWLQLSSPENNTS